MGVSVTETLDQVELVCEGASAADELTGSVQVDFLVRRHMGPGTEIAVLMNGPALDLLAEALKTGRTPEFDQAAVREAGRLWVEMRHSAQGRYEPILMISRSTLESHPELIDAVRSGARARS